MKPGLTPLHFTPMKQLLLSFMLIGLVKNLGCQIPVEVFAGQSKSTVDIMFFRFFKKDPETSPWLLFNRNRASIDYRMTDTAYLPLFGFTEAISYNHSKLRGFAPVALGQVLSYGVFAKAGIQYAYIRPDFTVFTWLVTETRRNPDLDFFILLRYTPQLTGSWRLFTQYEGLQSVPSSSSKPLQTTQRLRVGLQHGAFQLGAGADFSQTMRPHVTYPPNIGAFIRREF